MTVVYLPAIITGTLLIDCARVTIMYIRGIYNSVMVNNWKSFDQQVMKDEKSAKDCERGIIVLSNRWERYGHWWV